MAAEKGVALVVRGSDWSETSRIATLFTREFGKVRALAKGGRRLRSTFEIAFDLLTVADVVFLRSRSGGLDLLTEARLDERFPALRANLAALYVGYYVAELLADGTQDYDPHPMLFDAAVATLRSLETDTPTRELASRFELVWLHELGYSPRLESCAGCGREKSESVVVPRMAYSIAAGGILCPKCAPAARDPRLLTRPVWLALKALAAGDQGPALDDSDRQGVRQILGQTVSHVLGRRPRLLTYVDAP